MMRIYDLLQIIAPGFSHLPKTTGSVARVTVAMISASFTASGSESYATALPPMSRTHFSAFACERPHTRTYVQRRQHYIVAVSLEREFVTNLSLEKLANISNSI